VSRLAVVCVGGGRGTRYGQDKLALDLGGRSVLEVSVAALRAAFPEAPLVTVVPAERCHQWRSVLGPYGVESVVAGGERRQDSVRRGVDAVCGPDVEWVVIHDAARPLAHPEDMRATAGAVDGADGAVLCAHVADTVKRVDGSDFVQATLDRGRLRLALTPQVFRVEALRRAWAATGWDREWTDESALLEEAGLRMRCVEARHANPKLTVPRDLDVLRALLASRGA